MKSKNPFSRIWRKLGSQRRVDSALRDFQRRSKIRLSEDEDSSINTLVTFISKEGNGCSNNCSCRVR